MSDFSHGEISYLVATAARAPSLHNSQPWRFRTAGSALELRADPARQLSQVDPDGREMLISCGAVLYGLRLGARGLGYLPDVTLLPDPAEPGLLARVLPGARAPVTREETELLTAMPHRHTHRGPFAPGPVTARLLAGLCADAAREGAQLELISQPGQLRALAALVATADREQQANAGIGAELAHWARPAGSSARDGVPAHAWAGPPGDRPGPPGDGPPAPGRLPQRTFGSPGLLPASGPPPAETAVLVTAGDSPVDWLRAGQALHRLLLRAAVRWVFASLQSQPLESPGIRASLSEQLHLPGTPQIVLQFGRANTAASTARRPPGEVLDTSGPATR